MLTGAAPVVAGSQRGSNPTAISPHRQGSSASLLDPQRGAPCQSADPWMERENKGTE
jgi:hypothetical protein